MKRNIAKETEIPVIREGSFTAVKRSKIAGEQMTDGFHSARAKPGRHRIKNDSQGSVEEEDGNCKVTLVAIPIRNCANSGKP